MEKTAVVESGGCRIAYDVRGEGPPVVLIQGVAVHGDDWRPQVDALASAYRCVTFDNRGMSRSQPVGEPIGVARMADDTIAVMDAEKIERAHVVGHSLGGLVALQLALASRERVRSLALLCTFADGRVATGLSPRMLWLGTRSRLGTARMRRNAFLEIITPPGALAGADRDKVAAEYAPLFGHDLAEQPPVTMKQLGAMRAYDATSRLAELAGIPTLVVSARHDPIAPPRAGRAIAVGIPGARFVELEDASHGVPIHDAARVNALLLEHLAGAERAGD